MKFSRIGKDMVRCVLTEQDMIENDVKLEDFFKNREKIHGFLEKIVEQAREEIGYEANGGMLAMQLMPLPNKGLSITFSENSEESFGNMMEHIKDMIVDDADETEDIQDTADDKKSRKNAPRIFRFNRLEDIEEYASAVPLDKMIKSSVYKFENDNSYYLILKKGKLKKKVYETLCFQALDYAELISDNSAQAANIQEHAKVIIKKNALGILKEL